MEEKYSEVIFKYYLPEHQNDVAIHVNAMKMLCLLHEIDNKCRSLIKWDDNANDSLIAFAEEIREMINAEGTIKELM
jgi:hypothetical protein